MKFEKITENKICIIFNIEDLNKENIDVHSFMSNSNESKKLFKTLLLQAEKELGFKTKNHSLVIEALATIDGEFILTITKNSLNKIIYAKKKQPINTNSCNIFCFSTLDDICNLFTSLSSTDKTLLITLFTDSSLYVYNSKYYLCLRTTINKLIFKFLEFSTPIKHSSLFEKYLSEYGSVIIENNVYSNITKYFI